MLDAFISVLKEKYNQIDNNFLFMAPTRKSVSNVRTSTFHSNKKGLSITEKKTLKELGGKFGHYHTKHKHTLKLSVIGE